MRAGNLAFFLLALAAWKVAAPRASWRRHGALKRVDAAARQVAFRCSTMKAELGSLNKVQPRGEGVGMLSCTSTLEPAKGDQRLLDILLVEVLAIGKHARSAVGMNALPATLQWRSKSLWKWNGAGVGVPAIILLISLIKSIGGLLCPPKGAPIYRLYPPVTAFRSSAVSLAWRFHR